jgi:hypothetical protein
MQRVLSAAVQNPSMIPADFLAYVVDYIQTQRLTTPLGQIIGYDNATNTIVNTALAKMFTAHVATSETEVNITSSSLATFTSAPSISSLDNGQYAVVWGTSGNGDTAGSGSALYVAVRANGSSDTNEAETQTQAIHVSIARAAAVTLSAGAGSNTLAMVARTNSAGHTSVLRRSWLLALKFSN